MYFYGKNVNKENCTLCCVISFFLSIFQSSTFNLFFFLVLYYTHTIILYDKK